MRPHPLHAFGLGALVAALAAGALVLLAPSRRMQPERHLPAVGRVPEVARAALSTQMRTHVRGMIELVSTATVLDYDATSASVRRLLDEPRVARPMGGGADELNAQLPARFFELQDELRANLETVGRAAAVRSPDALADSLGATMKTCIHCHDAYVVGH
jgi:hypothetical protein